jgi:hypothetical protein
MVIAPFLLSSPSSARIRRHAPPVVTFAAVTAAEGVPGDGSVGAIWYQRTIEAGPEMRGA